MRGGLRAHAGAACLAGAIVLALAAVLASALLLGCADDASTRPDPPVSACGAATAQHPDEGADHTLLCAPVAYGTNPPTSGSHYDTWAAYKTYADPVPDGFLVHSLEHGALVIGYRCPEGCADEVAAVQAWIDALPGDARCGGARPKVILAPNPSLDSRWAAAAWNWSWKAPCADTATLTAFFADHYGKTEEAVAGVCSDGGDLSSIGWCPQAE